MADLVVARNAFVATRYARVQELEERENYSASSAYLRRQAPGLVVVDRGGDVGENHGLAFSWR